MFDVCQNLPVGGSIGHGVVSGHGHSVVEVVVVVVVVGGWVVVVVVVVGGWKRENMLKKIKIKINGNRIKPIQKYKWNWNYFGYLKNYYIMESYLHFIYSISMKI